VRAWKERGLRPFAAIAADLVAGTVPRPAADVIAYIPPDGDRSLKRGHQPAADLARELAERWSLECAPLLERTRPVTRQTGLTRIERRRNVRGAFTAPRGA
jgi:predicted amidophosphoribosyltransferase